MPLILGAASQLRNKIQIGPLVFMGGLGYDERRNREVGGAIMQLASGYSHTITVPDINPSGSKEGTVIHSYPDGSELELSGKESLKRLGSDGAEVRFSKLHADRANRLIGAIESRGDRPVDAVFSLLMCLPVCWRCIDDQNYLNELFYWILRALLTYRLVESS